MIPATKDALARACPVCGAKAGRHCKWGLAMTIAGRARRAVHFGRTSQ